MCRFETHGVEVIHPQNRAAIMADIAEKIRAIVALLNDCGKTLNRYNADGM